MKKETMVTDMTTGNVTKLLLSFAFADFRCHGIFFRRAGADCP